VDNVHIGLTSSSNVTFAQESTGSRSASQPTCWFHLPTFRPTHRARPSAIRSMVSAQDSVMSASTLVHNQGNPGMQAAGLRSPRLSSVTSSAGLSATRGSGGT